MNKKCSNDTTLLFGVYGGLLALAIYVLFLNYGDAIFSKSPKSLAYNDPNVRLCLDAAAKENPNKLLFVSCSGFFDE